MDAYSQKFADWLLSRRPDWRRYVKPSTQDVFELEIPTLSPRAERPLWLTTEDQEITAGFDHTHWHFGNFAGEDEPEFARGRWK
jgi:hypothetical protein